MKVCVVHSYYSSGQPSGENIVVDAQLRILRQLGHDVTLLDQRTDDLSRRPLYSLESAARVATGLGSSPLARLEELDPDVVHVHNLFPNVGITWMARCRHPLVMTLHNFRPLCAAATLYRAGHPCRECLDHGPQRSLVHRCYRGSRAATLPWWLGATLRRRNDPLLQAPDVLITLSEQARDIYTQAAPTAHVECLPNPVDDLGAPPADMPRHERWLYAGRLSPEKGIVELLRAWPAGVAIDIAGDGPQRADVEAVLPASGRYLGRLAADRLRAALPAYTGLVFPSLWPEGAPMIYVEALSAGVPTVALRGNSVADNVQAQGTGLVVNQLSSESLRSAIREIINHGPRLRAHCRSVYDAHYTPESWADRLIALYQQAQNRRATRTGCFERRLVP